MAAWRQARALPLVLLCLFAFLSCSRGKPAQPPGPAAELTDPRARWYQLRDARLLRIDGPGAIAATGKLPWTVQSRVADMAFLGDELYLGLNGAGLARLRFDVDGPTDFSYFPDALIFPHRTITTLVPREGGLTVHLYYNALLNTVAADRLPIRGISMVAFLADRQDYAFLIPPFQRKNPAWEAVGFVPISEAEFLFEWKYTDPAETRFAYTRYFPSRRTESSALRSQYVAALTSPVESLPASSPRRRFFQRCLAELRAGSPGSTVLFTLRVRGMGVRTTFRSEGSAGSVVVVPVHEDKSGFRALLPGGRLLVGGARGERGEVALPAVPSPVRFTDLVKTGRFLVLAWEEQSFTEVGAAGVLVYSVDR